MLNMRNHRASLHPLLLGAFICSPLEAQEVESLLLLSLEELMNVEVTTTSKYNEQITDSPANIYVFDRKQIQQRGYRNLEDLLQGLPGVRLQKYSIPGIYNTVTVRGVMGNNKFLILQDGVRLSSPAGETTAIANNYPLYYAKRVEVLMGPASVVYGADAFLGVINIITPGNDDEDLGEISLSAGTDEYGYGYANMHHNFNSDSSMNMGIQGFRSQEYQFAEDFPDLYDVPGKSYDFDDTKEYQFFINYRPNDAWQFGLNHANHSASTDFTARPSFSAFDKGATEQIRQTTLYGRFTTDLGVGLRSSTLLTLMNYEVDEDSYFNNNFTGGVPGYKYANSDRISVNQDFEYQLDKKHLLSGGLVYDHFETIPKGANLPSPYNTSQGPGAQNQFYPNTTLPIQFFDRDYHTAGAYIQDNWKIDNQWRLVAGARFDYNSFYGNSSNPRASLIYKYDDRNLFKLLYGRAFLAPAPDQASTSFGSFTGAQNGSGEWLSTPFGFRVPNPDIKPERIQTLELNYEHWFNKNTHLKAVPFYNHIDDAILRKADSVPDQAIPGADLQSTFKFDNVGETETYGIELSINNLIDSGKWNFQNWGNFCYTDGELKKSGLKTELPMVSKYKLTAGTTVTYNKTYLLTPKLYWIGTTESNQPDPADNKKLLHVPSYFLMDMHAEAKVTATFTVKLDVYNLFDKTYTNAPFANPSFTLNRAPQTGRLTTMTLNYQF